MKQKVANFFKGLDLLIRCFNFGFFLVSLAVWLYVTAIEISSLKEAFQIDLLWKAFNIMYGNLSFKVGCIFLILFNGLQSIRNWIFKYYDLREIAEHVGTMSKIARHK